jgi:CDP-diacylglycerol---glycerol-3-phosphate 3-phosphatidyltransferase
MNLPNFLTFSRVLFAGLLVFFLIQNSLVSDCLAFCVFIVASLTDFYDGYFAKKRGLISDFGKIMDPIADKILILTIFAVLAYMGLIEWWMVVTIAAREILVTASRLHAMSKGQVLAAERAGKIKTVVQMAAIFIILLYLIASQANTTWFTAAEESWRSLINVFMVMAVFLTVGSGAAYFRNKWEKGQLS